MIVNDFFGGERNGSLSYFTWVIKVSSRRIEIQDAAQGWRRSSQANAALFASGVILLIEKVLLQVCPSFASLRDGS